jgi:DNA-binding transcriptional LysR family regulator
MRYVMAVIEHGSIGKAAEALHVSQPALSKSIRRLEEQLQVELFSRDARGTHPTIYSECMKAHAQAVNVGVAQALAEIRALKDGSTGLLTVAAPPSVAQAILPEAVMRLTRERPRLKVKIATFQLNPVPALLAGEYDLAVHLLDGTEMETGMKQRLLFHDRLVVIARPGHPLTKLQHVTVADLLPYGWILQEKDNLHRMRLERLFEAAGLPARAPEIECDSTIFMIPGVVRSDLLGIVPRLLLYSQNIDVATIEIDSPFMRRAIGFIWRENQVLTPSTKLFIDAVDGLCRERDFGA